MPFNFPNFILWCHTNNINILKFKKTQKKVMSFLNLIIKEFESPDFQDKLENPKEFFDKSSLRMICRN